MQGGYTLKGTVFELQYTGHRVLKSPALWAVLTMEKDYITVTEYAKLAGVSRQAVYNGINSGKYDNYVVKVTVDKREITALRREILKQGCKPVNGGCHVNDTLHFTTPASANIKDLQRQIEEYQERERESREREKHYINQIEEQQQIIKQQQTEQAELRKLLSNMQLLEAQRQQLQIASSTQQPETSNEDTAVAIVPEEEKKSAGNNTGGFLSWVKDLFR